MGHGQLTCTFIAIVRERWFRKHQFSSSRCPSHSGLCLRYNALNISIGQNRNAGNEPTTRGIYAVGMAMHDDGKPQFDRFVKLSFDDITTWVCGDYHLEPNMSSPLFVVFSLYRIHYLYVIAPSRYHELPTFTATGIEYMLSGYFANIRTFILLSASAFRTCSVVG